MYSKIRAVFDRLFKSKLAVNENSCYEDDSYDFDYECTLRHNQIDLNALRALECFYKNKELFLNFCTDKHSVFSEDKEDFICSIYNKIEAVPEARYSKNYSINKVQDYVWNKNAYFWWDPTITSFNAQFNRNINRNTYIQEKRDYRKEWEAFKQMHGDGYRDRYKEFSVSKSYTQYHYHTILGLDNDVKDLRVVKKAYHKKMKEHHPDKFSGSSEAEVKNNEEMSKNINEAYTYLEKKLSI